MGSKRMPVVDLVFWAGLVTALIGAPVIGVLWVLRDHLPSNEAVVPRSLELSPLQEKAREAAREEAREREEGRRLAESFLADVQAGRLDQAYNAFTVLEDREKIRRDDFADCLRKMPVFRNPRRSMPPEHPKGYDYYWNAESTDGEQLEIEVSVEHRLEGKSREDTALKITFFRVGHAYFYTDRRELRGSFTPLPPKRPPQQPSL
jgi:hypothetical protein